SAIASAASVPCVVPAGATFTPATNFANTFSFTCGGLTFSNFLLTSASPATLPNANVSISIVGAAVILAPPNIPPENPGFGVVPYVDIPFNPNLPFGVPPAYPQDIHFFYTVSGGVNQIDLSVGGVGAMIIETACRTQLASQGNPTGQNGNNSLVESTCAG